MVETLKVSLSGPAFSLLLYENARSDYDQEGFLLGEITKTETNSITDNDEQVMKIDRVIKINSAIPAPNIGYFYKVTGKIDGSKIGTFLGNERSKVVAWYKFKRSNAFKLSVREKIVHKGLARFLGIPENLFTCCLLTSSFSRIAATHLYSQTFIRYNELNYQNVPMHIVNLSNPKNMYKHPEPCSETFDKLFQSLSIDSKRTSSINVITKVNTALQEHTDDLVVKLSKAEIKMHELEQKVKLYKDRIKEKASNQMENCLIPIENGRNINDNLPNISPAKTKPPQKSKRSRNNTLKDNSEEADLKVSGKSIRKATVAQTKNKK